MFCLADGVSGVDDRLTELTLERHGAWSWKPPSGYAFARTWRSVPLGLGEVLAAAACFPIVFSPAGLPHALLRLSEDGNSAFVGEAGQWQASLLPERLRCFPFGLAGEEELNPKLAVYEGSDFVFNGDALQAIFTSSAPGQFTDEFRLLSSALHRQASSLFQAHQAASALRELGLLEPFAQLDGFAVAAHSGIKGLCGWQVQQLWSVKGFGLLYAGAMSLTHLPWMEKAERLLAQSAISTCRPKNPKSTRASRFLDALSSAPELDQPTINFQGK